MIQNDACSNPAAVGSVRRNPRHEGNHIVSPIWAGIGIGSMQLGRCRYSMRIVYCTVLDKLIGTYTDVRVGHLRFCTANILAAGNCFFDLMLHAARYIYANIRVVYQRQPSYFSFVRSLVGLFVCFVFLFVCLFVCLGWVGLG